MVYTSDVITMLQDGLYKVIDGITSFDEIYRIIDIDDDLNIQKEVGNTAHADVPKTVINQEVPTSLIEDLQII